MQEQTIRLEQNNQINIYFYTGLISVLVLVGAFVKIVSSIQKNTKDTALRLAKFFGNSAEFWMNVQNKYDLETARDALFVKIDDEVKLYHAL